MTVYHQVTNRVNDPHCIAPVAQSWQVTITRDANNRQVVTPLHMSSHKELSGTVTTRRGSPLRDGDILVHITDGMNERCGQLSYHKSAEKVANINIRDNVWATVSRIIAPTLWNELWIFGDTPVTLISCGLYSAEDWEHVLDQYHAGKLPTPFFAGDTDPR